MRLALAALLLPVLVACGGDADPSPANDPAPPKAEPSVCERAVEKAAKVDAGQDAHADLWPAFEACADMAEFTAAANKHPDALDGADAATYVGNQCQYEAEVADSMLCGSLG